MREVSSIDSQNTTIKSVKLYRTRPAVIRKIVAFEELQNLKQNKPSARETTKLLEIPNSTMQAWIKQAPSQREGLAEFFSTPVGADFLQKSIVAVMKLMKCGPGGIHGMQEYLHNTGLDSLVASSEGALQNFWVRCEEHIIGFGKKQESRLAEKMRSKKITAGLDEIFRGKRPCLVAMDVVSNYILLEKFTEDRTASTWRRELEPRLGELNIKVTQVVSDLCGAIRAVTKGIGAEHISELFHAQHEISKATSAPLASQERACKNALGDAEKKIKKLKDKPRKMKKELQKKQLKEIKEVEKLRGDLKIELEEKTKRREKLRSSVQEMAKIHHPIDLKSGKLQTAEKIKDRFNEQFDVIDKCVEEADLSKKSEDRVNKSRRAFDAIIRYMQYFYVVYAAFVEGLELNSDQANFFNEVIFPLSYLKMIWKRSPRRIKEEITQLLQTFEVKARDGPWSEELKRELMKKGQEISETFQKSSSCVEGRNCALSLNYHRFHRLNERALKALTIVHNFDTKRKDGTTAAERFFGAKHENLFDSLVANVRIPGKPQNQHHDKENRRLGWEKRRIA